MSAAAATAMDKPQGWLANVPLDLAIAFAWVLFYAWILSTPLIGRVDAAGYRPALDLATTIAFGINFIHRHFVYLLFFGDKEKRNRHPVAVWLLPVAFVVVVAARFAPRSVFDAILWILAGWNVWHTLMQRHGIFRAYAARSGGGVDNRAHGRLDLALLWSLALATAGAVMAFDQDTFAVAAVRAWRAIPIVSAHPEVQIGIFVVTSAVAVVVAALWLRAELRASPRTSRVPRLLFLCSTLALLGVFVAHGPVVGFLVFSSAHAIEYVLFVFVYTRKRARNDDAPAAIRVLGRALPLAVLSVALVVAFAVLHPVWTVPAVVIYYTTTSALHYVYDGLIWKIRRPEVRAPLVAA